MAIYTLKKSDGSTLKYEGTEESAKMLASAGGYSIGELPSFTPYTTSQINTKIASNTGSTVSSPTIIAEQIANQKAINLPTYTAPTIPTVTTPPENQTSKNTTSEPDWWSKYLSDYEAAKPVDTVSLYNQAYSSSGLQDLTSSLTSKQNTVTEAQKELDLLNAKLTGITNEATAAQQTLESQAGTGKDVTGTFLGRQQQEISRQAAIKSLPVQAEVLAAQAKVASAQGDVTTAQNAITLAQDKLNTTFKIQSDYATSVYNYNKELRDTLYDYATKQEEAQLKAQQNAEDRAFELYKNNIANAQSIAKTAMENGQADIAAKITALDPSSDTYRQDLADLQSQIKVEPDVTIKDLPDGRTVAIDKKGNIVKTISSGGVGGVGEELYTGLKSATATAVRAKVSAFKSEPVVTNFSTIQEGRNFANSISTDTTNPADDQALIYSLAKALDPSSVVREGEYATAQKYAQSWVKAYGKGVEQALAGTGFLSKEARQNIKNTIETKYNASKKSYDNIYNQYTKGIDSLTGRNDGSKFLVDYKISDIQNVEDLSKLNNNDFLNVNPSVQSITEATGQSFFDMFPDLGIEQP